MTARVQAAGKPAATKKPISAAKMLRSCWRRLRDWQHAGVWDLIHFALLDCLARDDQIDGSRRARIVALRPSQGRAPSASKTAGTRHPAIMYTM